MKAAAAGQAKTSEGRAADVERMIAATLADLGYEIVRVMLSGSHRLHLQVMIERQDGVPIDVDDCATASRAISAVLDVEDPIAGAYELEVSSPGIDRPLTRLRDFERFTGFDARIETLVPHDGRRRWRGRLLGLSGEDVRLALEDGSEVVLPFGEIAKAKLVMTDELLASANRGEP